MGTTITEFPLWIIDMGKVLHACVFHSKMVNILYNYCKLIEGLLLYRITDRANVEHKTLVNGMKRVIWTLMGQNEI